MKVTGTASTLAELMTHAAAAGADVVLLDFDLGDEDTSASIAVLCERCPGHVLVLTGEDDIDAHRAVMLKGARGVIHKSEPRRRAWDKPPRRSHGDSHGRRGAGDRSWQGTMGTEWRHFREKQ